MNSLKALRPIARAASTAASPRKAYVRKPVAAKATPSPVKATPSAAPALAKASPPSASFSAADFSAADMLDESGMDDLLPEIPLPPTHASPALAPSSFAAPTTLASTTSSAFPSTSTGFPAGPSIAQTTAPAPTYATVPLEIPQAQKEIDWSTSYHGLSAQPFSERAASLLMRPLLPNEIEIKPDGLLYLPEILYRRILNQAFGPGGWGMVPRGEMTVLKMMVSREWGLVAGGRLVSVARGEQTFFNAEGLPTATEGCKSNALMRCCKDLGIASELWDPAFIRVFKATHCHAAMTEHASTKKKQQRWRKKGNKFEYPLIEVKSGHGH